VTEGGAAQRVAATSAKNLKEEGCHEGLPDGLRTVSLTSAEERLVTGATVARGLLSDAHIAAARMIEPAASNIRMNPSIAKK
jgi:hypothetical protein